jgi:hypothetical protein
MFKEKWCSKSIHDKEETDEAAHKVDWRDFLPDQGEISIFE